MQALCVVLQYLRSTDFGEQTHRIEAPAGVSGVFKRRDGFLVSLRGYGKNGAKYKKSKSMEDAVAALSGVHDGSPEHAHVDADYAARNELDDENGVDAHEEDIQPDGVQMMVASGGTLEPAASESDQHELLTTSSSESIEIAL